MLQSFRRGIIVGKLLLALAGGGVLALSCSTGTGGDQGPGQGHTGNAMEEVLEEGFGSVSDDFYSGYSGSSGSCIFPPSCDNISLPNPLPSPGCTDPYTGETRCQAEIDAAGFARTRHSEAIQNLNAVTCLVDTGGQFSEVQCPCECPDKSSCVGVQYCESQACCQNCQASFLECRAIACQSPHTVPPDYVCDGVDPEEASDCNFILQNCQDACETPHSCETGPNNTCVDFCG